MSQCGDYEDINFYVINEFYGIVIAVYFLPFKKNHPVHSSTMWTMLINPRTTGGLSHLRTAGGGGGYPPPRDLEN